MTPDRIALIGFMGSGKTTVGRILAARLGWELVDTDDLVEQRAGAPVADIFRDRGERAFRDLEAEVIASLAGRTRLVVATGGGAPAQPRNRGFFSGDTATFHLRVSYETARARTRGDPARPLLSLAEGAVRGLYASRQSVYEELGKGVETEGLAPEEVMENVVQLLSDPNPTQGIGDNA